MVVCGAHACRAAADDLNTALGGDLKLTDFGPRLPQLLRDAELGDFFVRRVRGEGVRMGVNVWSPASPQPWFGTMRAEAAGGAGSVRSESDCDYLDMFQRNRWLSIERRAKMLFSQRG